MLKTRGSARPAPPPPPLTDVPPANSPLRPSPLPYNTPTDLPTTIEELLAQLPDYHDVSPPPPPE